MNVTVISVDLLVIRLGFCERWLVPTVIERHAIGVESLIAGAMNKGTAALGV